MKISPITSSDIENGPRDRLKAFEDLWEATFGSLADDRAYADCDTDLDRRFLAAKHAVENLIKGCEQHLDWVSEQPPLRPMTFAEWNA